MKHEESYLNDLTSSKQTLSEFLDNHVLAAAGGVIIGGSVALRMLLTGEILGVSGIVSGFVNPTGSHLINRLLTVAGFGLSALVFFPSYSNQVKMQLHRSPIFFAVGGLMVGVGTTLGNGCTSGHGIAGLARFSIRSVVAVGVFFATNIIATTLMSQFFGVGNAWRENLLD